MLRLHPHPRVTAVARRLQPPRRLPSPATKRARDLKKEAVALSWIQRAKDLQKEAVALSCQRAGILRKGVKHPTITLVFDVAMPIVAFNVLTRYSVATL